MTGIDPHPPYFRTLREKNQTLTPLDIERSILRSWKAEWSTDPTTCPYNFEDTYDFHPKLEPVKVTGWTQHMLRYQKEVMPKVGINPWIVRMHQGIERTLYIEKRKIANFIGSKNSGKTNYFALLSHLALSINPSFTRVFVSGPYKTAADATIWGRIGTRYTQMREANRDLWKKCSENKSKARYIYDEHSDEAGYIELITLDKVGKLQGTKSLDPTKGLLLLVCDEIAEFPTAALLDALDNLTGNGNFLCLTGCNFRDPEGLEGKLCKPEGVEYSELNMDHDFEWKSNYKSMTFRFDGHQSPNILAGEVIYPYLLTPDVRRDMEEIHGLRGPKYLEQIRSFPNSSMSDYYVTTREKIRGAGGWDEVVWDVNTSPVKVAFADPGFGGDPCKIGAFKFGPARVQSADGMWHPVSIFQPINTIETIKIDTALVADEVWLDKVAKYANGEILVRRGALVTPEQQIAIGTAEFLERNGIERSHFGYDGSMRSGIVHEMVAMLGTSIHSIDFGGMATDRVVDIRGTLAKEAYFNFVTEMHFNIAATIQAGQFRGAQLIDTAISQLVRRGWEHTGAKKQIQTKTEYKKMNQGRSPDDSDVLIGAHEIAMRLGFRSNFKRTASSAEASLSAEAFMSQFAGLKICMRRTSKPLKVIS